MVGRWRRRMHVFIIIWIMPIESYSVTVNAPRYYLSILTYGLLWVYLFLLIIWVWLCMSYSLIFVWFIWLYLMCAVCHRAMDNEHLCHSIPYLSGVTIEPCATTQTQTVSKASIRQWNLHAQIKATSVSYLGLSLTTQTDTCCRWRRSHAVATSLVSFLSLSTL